VVIVPEVALEISITWLERFVRSSNIVSRLLRFQVGISKFADVLDRGHQFRHASGRVIRMDRDEDGRRRSGRLTVRMSNEAGSRQEERRICRALRLHAVFRRWSRCSSSASSTWLRPALGSQARGRGHPVPSAGRRKRGVHCEPGRDRSIGCRFLLRIPNPERHCSCGSRSIRRVRHVGGGQGCGRFDGGWWFSHAAFLIGDRDYFAHNLFHVVNGSPDGSGVFNMRSG